MDDIDYQNTVKTVIGDGAISPFRGNFDGNEHTVSNFSSSNSYYAGFFGYLVGARVEKMGIHNAMIDGVGVMDTFTGGVAGAMDITSAIHKCFVSDGIVSSTADQTGGIVGVIYNNEYHAPTHSHIYSCYTTCAVFGKEKVGGIVGNCLREAWVDNLSFPPFH